MLKNDYKPKSIRQSGQYHMAGQSRGKFRLALVTSVVGIAILIFSLTPSQAPATLSSSVAVIKPLLDSDSEDSRTELDLSGQFIKAETNLSLIDNSTESNQTSSNNNRQALALSIDKSFLSPETEVESANQLTTVTIKSGDSLATIFQKQSIPARELQLILKLGDAAKPLTRIMPGKTLDFIKNPEQQLIQIRYPLNSTSTLIIDRETDGYRSNIKNIKVLTELVSVQGVIKDSLFLSGKQAGLSDNLIMEMAQIFGWDIDFILDIRSGDRFNVVYEKRYGDGELIGDGRIVAAEFINQGKSYRAVHYTDSKGNSNYYTPEGLSMRKTFLRAPLNFLYVSSKFNPKRFHPILKRVKAHRGIDYRAATGTPVYAAGDGKVIKAGYDKYNGNYIFIQHGERYVTKYLHLSKKKVKRGRRVKQGQTIGLVGSTGMSQAPHLHYEFLVNGVHRNSRTVSLPKAKSIAKKEKLSFTAKTKNLISRLDLEDRLYAANTTKK